MASLMLHDDDEIEETEDSDNPEESDEAEENARNFFVPSSVGQQQFVEEIDYNEIETVEVVGKGSFGVVWKGRWRGQYVAVKHIDTEGERRAFAVEVRQLSRVSHPNIVRLYGACTNNPVCLVMEYAEGGSLYNVLHCEPQPLYTIGHAMSWTLQCACGVAYLHNMKPKPLIHRDLKPPNLLLIDGGRILKICDFGTACDLNTYMTNNKGSAAWMAPEVFEGSRYTEKCDVFSWGIILWEVLSRRKPFAHIGGSAYRIMWAVHIGQRPPLMEGCPPPIEDLMTRCWRKIPEERPSMNEIVEIMTHLSEFFSKPSYPLEYSISEVKSDEENMDTRPNADISWDNDSEPQSRSSRPLNNENPDNVDHDVTIVPPTKVTRADDEAMDVPVQPQQNCESSASQGHFQPLHVHCEPDAWESVSSEPSWEIRNMAGLDKMLPKNAKKSLYNNTSRSSSNSPSTTDDLEVYGLLDAELRPLTPDSTSKISQDIFNEHKQLAQKYLKVQTEIALLGQQKTESLKNLSADTLKLLKEIEKFEDEKVSLVKLYRNLKRQLEIMKTQVSTSVEAGETASKIASPAPTATANDGWVVVPCQEPSRIA